MELQAINTANYLDILFDNRNKAYGGYELRKNQDKRTLTAFSLVIGSIIIVCVYTTFFNHPVIQVHQTAFLPGDLTPANIKPPVHILPQKPQLPPPADQPTKTVKSTPTIIVPDNETQPSDMPVENSKLTDAVPASTNTDGNAANAGTPSVTGSGTAGNTPVATNKPNTPFSFVQEMPEFIGNFNTYLQKQLVYPNAARENGIEGQVVVQFIVNEDGRISGAKIIRGIGGGCNEEALRVVNNMPAWKPGKQNNQAVKVYYTLPIRFQLG